MPKLTETYVRKLPQAKSGTKVHWDSEVRGLGLFVGKRTKTWHYQRDVGGRTTRKLIGRYPTISASAARQAALGFALDMARGAGRIYELSAPTLEEALEAYLARPKLRSEDHKDIVRAMMHNHLPDWLRLPLDEIDRRMVVERHGKLADRPSLANHLFRSFRTIWNNARRTSTLPEPPTLVIEWHAERVDNPIIEDLGKWRRNVDGMENPIHAVYYWLLLFTGFRKAEAQTLQWRHVHENHIHLPMTKNGRAFDFPTTKVHAEILRPLRGLHSDWVFPSLKSRNGHITNPGRIEWSAHAHRRTFATVAIEAGVLEEIVGRLLNHTPLTVTGARYAKPSLGALRPQLETIATELLRRVGGPPFG